MKTTFVVQWEIHIYCGRDISSGYVSVMWNGCIPVPVVTVLTYEVFFACICSNVESTCRLNYYVTWPEKVILYSILIIFTQVKQWCHWWWCQHGVTLMPLPMGSSYQKSCQTSFWLSWPNVTHKSEVTFGPQCVPTFGKSWITSLNFRIRIININVTELLPLFFMARIR